MSDNPKMSKWHQKLDVPNPEKKIGETSEGKPIFMDMRELISSPDETAERWQITLENRKQNLVNSIAKLVLDNGAKFIEETVFHIASKTGRDLYSKGDAIGMFKYCNSADISCIQDGLKTVVRVRGKVIREMDAGVPPAIREAVAKRVNEIVHKLPVVHA